MVVTLKKATSETHRNRCIIIVGKNVEKKAVGRNKIKRRLRAILRPLFKTERKKLEIRVTAKPGIQALSFQELKWEVEKLYGRTF